MRDALVHPPIELFLSLQAGFLTLHIYRFQYHISVLDLGLNLHPYQISFGALVTQPVYMNYPVDWDSLANRISLF